MFTIILCYDVIIMFVKFYDSIMKLVVLLTTHQQLHQNLPLLAAWLLLLHSSLHTQHLEDPSRRGDRLAVEKSWTMPSARDCMSHA